MAACQDYDELLTLQAAGALEPDEEARVRAHLETCAACRSEFTSTQALLSQVALPSPSPAAQATLESLPRRVLGTWRREQVRQAIRMRAAGALLAAAAAVLLVLAPAWVRRGTSRPPPSTPVAPTASSVATTASEETQSAFEQWAAADPLAEALAPAEDEAAWGDDAEAEADDLTESELFLDSNGETL